MKSTFLILSFLLLISACSQKQSSYRGNKLPLLQAVMKEPSPQRILGRWKSAPRKLREALHRVMEESTIPGMGIVVIDDFRVQWTEGFGYASLRRKTPITPKTLFRVASLSKAITAVTVLSLSEKKILSLNKDVNHYLTTWNIPPTEHTQTEKVTLEKLLSHTAGINLPSFPGYAKEDSIPTLFEVLEGINTPHEPIAVHTIPGTEYQYSGGGYCIIQQLLEDVLKKPFPQIVQETVFTPLDMHQSTFTQFRREKKHVATPYVTSKKGNQKKILIYPQLAAAGLWSTPLDMAKFVLSIQSSLQGSTQQLLSPQTAHMLTTPKKPSPFGLGVKIKDDTLFYHLGEGKETSCVFFGHLNKGYGAVIMMNTGSPQIHTILDILRKYYNWEVSNS